MFWYQFIIISQCLYLLFRCCKGFIYKDIKRYKVHGKHEGAVRDNAKKDLGRLFKRVFGLNAFQVRQGKGTSNNGKDFKIVTR